MTSDMFVQSFPTEAQMMKTLLSSLRTKLEALRLDEEHKENHCPSNARPRITPRKQLGLDCSKTELGPIRGQLNAVAKPFPPPVYRKMAVPKRSSTPVQTKLSNYFKSDRKPNVTPRSTGAPTTISLNPFVSKRQVRAMRVVARTRPISAHRLALVPTGPVVPAQLSRPLVTEHRFGEAQKRRLDDVQQPGEVRQVLHERQETRVDGAGEAHQAVREQDPPCKRIRVVHHQPLQQHQQLPEHVHHQQLQQHQQLPQDVHHQQHQHLPEHVHHQPLQQHQQFPEHVHHQPLQQHQQFPEHVHHQPLQQHQQFPEHVHHGQPHPPYAEVHQYGPGQAANSNYDQQGQVHWQPAVPPMYAYEAVQQPPFHQPFVLPPPTCLLTLPHCNGPFAAPVVEPQPFQPCYPHYTVDYGYNNMPPFPQGPMLFEHNNPNLL